jgi:RNA polymerase sigma-70 factor (ECF subfamily)
MPSDESFIDLQVRLRGGDATAGAEIFSRYRESLIRLAAPRLVGTLRTKVDPEDVVQSAFRSFFRAEAESGFALAGWGDLWSLLVTITLRKCRHQVRQFLAAKRDVRREAGASDSLAGWQAVAADPTPEEAAEFADIVERLLGGLDDRGRRIALLSLEGRSPAEISPHVGLTERSVYRQLDRIRDRLQQLAEPEGHP